MEQGRERIEDFMRRYGYEDLQCHRPPAPSGEGSTRMGRLKA